MPDYTAHLEFRAPTFVRSEYRVLKRQLLQRFASDDRVTQTHTDIRERVVTAIVVVTASSSSRAHADAASRARVAATLLRRVRTSAIEVSVSLEHPGSEVEPSVEPSI